MQAKELSKKWEHLAMKVNEQELVKILSQLGEERRNSPVSRAASPTQPTRESLVTQHLQVDGFDTPISHSPATHSLQTPIKSRLSQGSGLDTPVPSSTADFYGSSLNATWSEDSGVDLAPNPCSFATSPHTSFNTTSSQSDEKLDTPLILPTSSCPAVLPEDTTALPTSQKAHG
jgi:hypothetical protein